MLSSRLLSPRIANMHIYNYECLEYYVLITPLYIIAEVAGLPKIPGTVNMHRDSDNDLLSLNLFWDY